VDLYLKGKENVCEVCGINAPTKQIEFRQNIGALVRRYSRSVKGRLCKKCINEYFWKYTLTTLAIGWFGAISVFVAPVFIGMNIFYYLRALKLKYNY